MIVLSLELLTYTVFLLAISGSTFALTESPLVTLEDGDVMGTVKISRNKSEFAAFMGMPFAKPPLGELRFKRPVPNDPWTDVFGKLPIDLKSKLHL